MAAKKERVPSKLPSKPRAPARATPENRAAPENLRQLISEAAYYRAKRRGFAPGHELEDWIQAEAEVMGRIAQDR
jgi:hypothetical protein